MANKGGRLVYRLFAICVSWDGASQEGNNDMAEALPPCDIYALVKDALEIGYRRCLLSFSLDLV
jgi:hypothetical protein